MSNKSFYGIVEVITTKVEEYDRKIKGKVVKASRKVTTKEPRVILTDEVTRMDARLALEGYAAQHNGTVTDIRRLN